jgi:hypothetical protein
MVEGFPSLTVSEHGDVVRLASSRQQKFGNKIRWRFLPEQKLNARITGAGYMAVQTKTGGGRATLYVHRLVAQAFIPRPPHCNEVNHLDGDKRNNSLENLEWTTHSANLKHAYATGLFKNSMSANEVLALKELLANGVSISEVARRFGLAKSTVAGIRSGHSWAWLQPENYAS